MNGYITTDRYQTVYDLPIQLPQTELRRGRFLICGAIQLLLGQTLRVRCFNLHLINIITPENSPVVFSSPLGLVCAGIYTSPMVCSGAIVMASSAPGVTAFNSFQYRDIAVPGTYYFAISNNTRNIDLTVALTGVAKILNG